jgi:hypothetical protein
MLIRIDPDPEVFVCRRCKSATSTTNARDFLVGNRRFKEALPDEKGTFSSGTRLGAATGELMMSRSHLSCSSIS